MTQRQINLALDENTDFKSTRCELDKNKITCDLNENFILELKQRKNETQISIKKVREVYQCQWMFMSKFVIQK